MKFILTTLLLLVLTACGGDTNIDENHLVDPININGTGSGCTPEVLAELDEVTELCSRNPLIGEDRELCFSKATEYQQKYPKVVCNLEGEAIITAQLVEDELEEIEDEEEELINSGIFDD